MCGNPHFSRCIHQMRCVECEAFIDHEQAEAIERREGVIPLSRHFSSCQNRKAKRQPVLVLWNGKQHLRGRIANTAQDV